MLLERFFAEEEIGVAELKAALRKATIAGKLVPVLNGSALKNKGVQPLLDAVVDYLPSPLDVPPVTGTNPRTGEEESAAPDPNEPFCALAFKIVTDPFVGKLAFIRVYSGTLKTGSYAYNSTRDQRERVGRLVQLHANERKDIPEVQAGRDRRDRRAQRHDHRRHAVRRDAPDRPRSDQVPRAGDPRGHRAEDQAGPGQDGHRAGQADATRTRRSASTATPRPARRSSPAWASCTSKCIVDRLMREHRVDANVGRPQVAYRETITQPAQGARAVQAPDRRPRHVRRRRADGRADWSRARAFSSSGRSSAARCRASTPRPSSGRRARRSKAASSPTTRWSTLKVTAVDGSYHEVDSNEMAFKIAASQTAKAALRKASPQLLEPVMEVEVTTRGRFPGRRAWAT